MATFLPFNFNPSNVTTFTDESYSYTVPAGYYAIVTYTISVSAYPLSLSTNVSQLTSGENSNNGTIYLGAGDALTRSVVTADESASAVSAADFSEGKILVNGSVAGSARAYSSFLNIGNVTTYTFGGACSIEATISEYLIP